MDSIAAGPTVINPVTTLTREGEVGIIAIAAPPVNALSLAVREGIIAGLRSACTDPAIRAIVLICEERTFFAGADISEFGKPIHDPSLWEVVAALDSCDRPIVAAMHGTALGGGFEVALACHYRVGSEGMKCGLPEVTLGLLPAAGGTQRLPRLIGLDRALDMIMNGKPVSASTALEYGIIDDLVPEEALRARAVDFARARLIEGAALRRLGDTRGKLPDEAGCLAAIARFRDSNEKALQLDAPQACVDAIEEACRLPFEEGLALERRLFEKLVNSAQARARRYVFFAERQVTRIPDVPADTPLLPVATLGIVGGGMMGRGIAIAFLNAGFSVILAEMTAVARDNALGAIAASYDGMVRRGRIDEAKSKSCLRRLSGTTDLAALAECGLIVEAVFEDMAVKQALFRSLDAIACKEAILATNTSFLDVDAIAGVTARPERVLGLHFFSPANIMRLLELVRARATSPQVIATALAIGRTIGKLPVLVGNCHGFVGNRILAARQREADRLILEGVKPWSIDRVHVEFGMPMGPYAMYDMAGLDLGWSAETSRGETVIERLCEAGRRGQKTGAGFYDYDGRVASPSATSDAIIASVAHDRGIAPRPASDSEIWDRCAYAMINEAAHILEQGIAIRASDIDLIWINGYGWPAHTGGPLFYADETGLGRILESLTSYEQRYGADFTPAPLLRTLVAEGRTLTGS